MTLVVRHEVIKDASSIHEVTRAAFEQDDEAKLIQAIRLRAHPVISLVAEQEGGVVGHILFSPVTLTDHPSLDLMGLGPMAVDPGWQGQGIGSELVRAGLKECAGLGVGAVVVLGHPSYYPRFGFRPSVDFGIDSEYEVPAEVFMVTELLSNYLQGATGRIVYHDAFREMTSED